MNQRFSFTDFWSRYGRQDFEDTEMGKALNRLPDLSPEGPWLAGGSIRRMVAHLPQESDYDFFFRDQEQFDVFVDGLKERGATEIGGNDFNVTFELPATKAKPIGDNEFSKASPALKVQAIKISFYPTLDAVIDSFDFSICQCGYDGSDFVFGPWALFDIANKRLVPGRLSFGVSSIRRVIKYARQGYTICGGGIATMLEQIVEQPEIIQSKVEYID